VDVYAPGPGAQLDDMNPSTFPPLPPQIFWTTAVPGDRIDVHLGSGSATMEAEHVHVLDYGNIGNALFGGGPAPLPATVSYKVSWKGVDQRVNIRNTDPVYGGFAGEFIRNSAQMEWTATVGNYQFVSDPLSTSSSSFAEIGHERNGVFFP